MDELEIGGKRYISSRRAGKEHKYHPDYIGQLVRAGKVEGQKVGRAWYVDEVSLTEYLGKETPPHGPIYTTIENEKAEKLIEKIPEPVEKPKQEEPTAEIEETLEIEPTKDKEEIPVLIRKVAPQHESKAVPMTAKMPQRNNGGLVYIEDDAPLFPAVQRRPPFVTKETPVYEDSTQEERVTIRPTRPPILRAKYTMLRRGFVIVAVGGITFGAIALLSSRVLSVIKVQTGEPASVQYSLQ